jgi:hypothetical protein
MKLDIRNRLQPSTRGIPTPEFRTYEDVKYIPYVSKYGKDLNELLTEDVKAHVLYVINHSENKYEEMYQKYKFFYDEYVDYCDKKEIRDKLDVLQDEFISILIMKKAIPFYDEIYNDPNREKEILYSFKLINKLSQKLGIKITY